MRLDKYLADAGVGTRSEVKKYVKNRLITVDGATVPDPGYKIIPAQAQVCFKGAPVVYEEYLYYLLHKPAGCITARRDETQKTVMDYFPPDLAERMVPVGRLDKDTEGLLLLTNDGALNHRLTSPARHVAKRYYAVLDRGIPTSAAAQFAAGLDIGDEKPALAAKLQILPPEQAFDVAYEGTGCAHALVTVTEGRFHQVRRMFAAVGCGVLYLKRLSFGPLSLGTLKRGEYRKLTALEEALLKDGSAKAVIGDE